MAIAVSAAAAFTKCQVLDEARNIVEKSLSEEWDNRLLRSYREAAAAEGSAALRTQIEHCEAWLKTQAKNPELELTLGVLCFNQKLWGKAQVHMEDAIDHAQEPRTLREANLSLARLHEALGQAEQAAKYYRQCAIATAL